MRRFLLALPLALVLLLSLAGAASAHAVLVRADPPESAAADAAPARVILGYNEPIEPDFSKITVYDRGGRPLQTGPALVSPGDPTELSATLPKDLPKGIYTVSWQVVSADGHLVRGAYAFSVGGLPGTDLGGAAAAAARLDRMPLPPLSALTLHWLQYIAALLATGASAFPLLVLPVLGGGEVPDALSRRAATLALWAGGLLVVAFLLILPAHAAQVADLPFWQGWRPSLLWKVAADSNWGHAWLIGLPLAALLTLQAGLSGGRRPWLAGTAAAGGALLLSFPLGGHAVAVPENVWLSVAADWVHLAAAALWLGGLPLVLLSIRPLTGDPGALRRLVRRFSALAVVSVGLILATGLYQSLLHVPEWAALPATAYGRTLLIKVALVMLLLLMGLYNLVAAGPRLDRSAAAARGLRRAVSGEVALAAVVLAAAAVLTALPPAAAAYGKPFDATAPAGDLKVQLHIDPARAGYNQFAVQVTDSTGRPVADALRVRIEFTMTSHEMGEVHLDLPGAGGGKYAAGGDQLSMAGDWRLVVQVRRHGVDDVSAAFPVTVAATP